VEVLLANGIKVEQLLLEAAEKVKANEPGTLKYHLQKETKGDAPTFVMLEE
jgi:quinol monooxygenase YgiN